eukprot:scaffold16337_cov174-Isochrysis_galbana.AAC.1
MASWSSPRARPSRHCANYLLSPTAEAGRDELKTRLGLQLTRRSWLGRIARIVGCFCVRLSSGREAAWGLVPLANVIVAIAA